MPLLDNGLVAVAATPPECESFVKSSYRVLQELSESTTGELQEHCTHAVDNRMELIRAAWGEERAEISVAGLSKMIGAGMVSSGGKPQGSLGRR